MNRFKWYEWLVLIVLLAMLVVGAAFSPWGQRLLGSPDTPAWVQAIGSIAAILGTYLVAERQFKREQAQRQSEADRIERVTREESERCL
jgi:hypothetical protein